MLSFNFKRMAEVEPALTSSASAAPRSEILLVDAVVAIVIYRNECYRIRMHRGNFGAVKDAI
jgi:hypothetical protein